MKETIKRVLEYLQDENIHFWENCQCSEDIQESQDFNKCKCEENQNHILRDVKKIDDWLESAYCPLVDEDEIEIPKEKMTEITQRQNVNQESLNKCSNCELYFSTDYEGTTHCPELCDDCWNKHKNMPVIDVSGGKSNN